MVYDAQRKLVHRVKYEDTTSFMEILDLRYYSPGIYFIQVNDGFSMKSYKFEKK
jgi:hypothetical protein